MKQYRIIIMPAAEEGLLEIGEYIATDNPARAIKFLDEITQSLRKTLSVFPHSGKVVDNLDLGEEIRVLHYRNYNSYYRVVEETQTVEVLFIFNAGRDVQALIGSL